MLRAKCVDQPQLLLQLQKQTKKDADLGLPKCKFILFLLLVSCLFFRVRYFLESVSCFCVLCVCVCARAYVV